MSALPARHVLSKSSFVRGCQCPKSLWLYKNHFELRDKPSESQERIFMQGTDVGLLARELFGNGVDASPKDIFHYRESVRDTAQYIASGHNVIFEAAFQHEGVLCAVDILLKHKNKWYVYEVKSGTGVKPTFIQDAALQYYVLSHAGIELEDIFIVHINTGYIRSGDLQLKQLFAKQSVLSQVKALQPDISRKISELKSTLSQKFMPSVAIGQQCTVPYLCDFYSFCWMHNSADNNVSKELNESPNHEVVLPITEINYPVHFMDVNTYREAVPAYDGHWPYRRIPFQFTIVSIAVKGGDLVRQHFLAEMNSNPCGQFAEQLIMAVGNKGDIIVREKQVIKDRLKELQNDFKPLSDKLNNIINRLADRSKFKSVLNVELSAETNPSVFLSKEDEASAWFNLRNETDKTTVEKTLNLLGQQSQKRTYILMNAENE